MTQDEKIKYLNDCAKSLKEITDKYNLALSIQEKLNYICNTYNVPYRDLVSLLDDFYLQFFDEL